MHGRHYPIDPGFFRQLRQFHNAILRRPSDSHVAHRFLVHARQDRHRQQPWPVGTHRLRRADGLRCGMEHRAATERVHVHKLHAGHRHARQNRAGNGVRDVVEFQVKEDAGAECGYFAHRLRTRRREQLAADLEHADKIGNLFREFQRGR